MPRACFRTAAVAAALVIATTIGFAQTRSRKPLSSVDIDAIATLLGLEDARRFDEAELRKIAASPHPEVRRRAVQSVGRIADVAGAPILDTARADKDVDVAATAVWAAGQLRHPAAVDWLAATLTAPATPVVVAREAAIALGKIQAPEARAALARYLLNAPMTKTVAPIAGEALLSLGRFPGSGDLAPVLRWTTSPDVNVRWRATWALFRPRDPAAVPELLRLSADPSPEVRYWAVRGLLPLPGVDPAPAAKRLQAALADPDRRVRTEALRALGQHDDEASFTKLLEALDSPDTWLSVSAAELLPRHLRRADVAIAKLTVAAAPGRPLSLRLTARQALTRLGPMAKAALDVISSEGLPEPRPAGGGPRPQPKLLAPGEYRKIVEKWIVPDYNGRAKPRAIIDTPRGAIELELYPGDAPLGLEYFIRVVESGEIVGTRFPRVVPNFVAQQEAIRNDVVLRDEVSRRGLTRGNLSWASAGLDTGRPGYTFGVTPQPHNEGNFTALGRVVNGMDVVERLELGDTITGARLLAPSRTRK